MSDRAPGVLVLAELDGDEIADASLRALTLARDMAGDTGAGERWPPRCSPAATSCPARRRSSSPLTAAADVYAVDCRGTRPRPGPEAWPGWPSPAGALAEPVRPR